jgi:hypothetical protein
MTTEIEMGMGMGMGKGMGTWMRITSWTIYPPTPTLFNSFPYVVASASSIPPSTKLADGIGM